MSYQIHGVELGQATADDSQAGPPAPANIPQTPAPANPWATIAQNISQGATTGLMQTLTNLIPGQQRPVPPPAAPAWMSYAIPGAILAAGVGAAVLLSKKKKSAAVAA